MSTDNYETVLDDKEEIGYLISSIEESSKHARTLLFILATTTMYVLLTAFTGEITKIIELPILNVKMKSADFFLVSPILILFIYVYLHIYITELKKRMDLFDAITIHVRYLPYKRMMLFPWLLTFSNDKCQSTIYSKTITLISKIIFWYYTPVVLILLWGRYINQQDETSLMVFVCVTISLFYVFPIRKDNVLIPATVLTIIVFSFLSITIASVEQFREALNLNKLWSDFVTIVLDNSDTIKVVETENVYQKISLIGTLIFTILALMLPFLLRFFKLNLTSTVSGHQVGFVVKVVVSTLAAVLFLFNILSYIS